MLYGVSENSLQTIKISAEYDLRINFMNYSSFFFFLLFQNHLISLIKKMNLIGGGLFYMDLGYIL